MIARFYTVFYLALSALSLNAHAAALKNDGSPALSSNLEVRGPGLCCGLSQDIRDIQGVCLYMKDNCGGWDQCNAYDNDNRWCTYCVVTHPEDDACYKKTWPPADPAPVTKRGHDDSTMAPKTDLDGSMNEIATGHGQVQKRATTYVQTTHIPNTATTYVKTFGLVTVRIIVSALNVIVYNIQNSGASEIVWEIFDMTTGWRVNGNADPGETIGGHAPSQVLAKGGDTFELDIV
ncbi:hypothetical protein ColTof3_08305 [Colletotrichum tofieldiae]|nr:hypothetical protein ColTof3_08305 [Colletotrichum tofieldiae]